MRILSHWLEELSPNESIDAYRDLALSHISACEGSPQCQEIKRFILSDDIRALCEFEFDYLEEGLTPHVVKHARQALAFFTKLEDLEIGIDRDDVAFKKFLEAERLCSESNEIFKKVRRGEFQFSPRVSAVFHSAQRKISRVLGSLPNISELELRFGPGATRATRRQDASVRRKLTDGIQCSEDLLQWVPHILAEMPHYVDVHQGEDVKYEVFEDYVDEWVSVPVEITPAKLSFVPKNARTNRSICTEPGLNSMVQLGYGQYMAKRLAAFGVDIRDQTVNQRRASEGSLTGALATLDLSSASDTIATELVSDLLPLDWFSALKAARSGKVVLPNREIAILEKFSSMGNGFTFPLETLIFWSLAAACCSKDSDATVYGDDIIVPVDRYGLLVEVLNAVGFVVNLEKSYAAGPFRESCGKDYFRGSAVRPIYPRGWISAQRLFVLHNWYVRDGDEERALRVESWIHPALRIYGPDGFGDGHLLGDHPKTRPSKYDQRGYSGYFFDSFTTKSKTDFVVVHHHAERVCSLYSVYRRSAEVTVMPNPLVEGKWLEYKYGPLSGVSNLSLKVSYPSLPLPEKGGAKGYPLPGADGYKKISIYTLGG